MAITVRQVRAAAITSGGPTQDFVVSASAPGVAPKAAFITVVGATVSGTQAPGARLCIGVSDGTRQYCVSASANGNFLNDIPNALTRNRNSNTKCIVLLLADGTLDAEATVTFITNGVRLNWSNFPSTAVFVTVKCWFATAPESDLSAYAGNILSSSSIEVDTVINAASDPAFNFAAEQLIVLGNTTSLVWDSTLLWANLQLGFVDNGPSISQCCLATTEIDASPNSNCYALVSRLYASCNAQATIAIAITAFSSQGFTARTKLSGVQANYPYLALSYHGTCAHWAGVVSSPIVTGSPTESAPGFKPQFVLQATGTMVPGTADAVDLSKSTVATGAGGFGISGITATELFSESISDNDNNSFMLTESMSSGGIDASGVFRARTAQNPFADMHLAAFPTPQSDVFQATGWKLAYSIAHATTRKWPGMAVGEWTAPAAAVVFSDRVDADLEVGYPEVVSY